ncbi:hypothetical protein B472_16615 [Limnohabitans sp. Rim28]|nr:hypothetical protein B472_16615 [Limnohabitans sp. Rim28]
MRALTGLSCSQTGKTGAAGKDVSLAAWILTPLVFRGFREAVLAAGLRWALGGLAATGTLDAAGAGVGSGASSALDVAALRGLTALTSGASCMLFKGSGVFGVSGELGFSGVDFLWATLEPSVTWTECGLSLRIKVDFFMVYQGLVSD